jgi:hypothetical protein
VAKIGFFTAVNFGGHPKSCTQSLLEIVDGYFYLGGKKAYVISGYTQQASEETTLRDDSSTHLVTAIKIISYATLILPAIMLIAKIVLRSIHTFHTNHSGAQREVNCDFSASDAGSPIKDGSVQKKISLQPYEQVQQRLEKGIDISQDTIQRIGTLMPTILSRKNDAEITRHASGGNLVFSLVSTPSLIFKMASPGGSVFRAGGFLSPQQQIESRFANMVKAVEVCTTNRLDLLVVPHAKKFNVNGVTLIAEERLDINQNESAQEHLYQLPGLDKTVRQLAIFIAKTGFSDVVWRNIPLVDTASEFQGDRRIALVDLEEMNGAEEGIFGGAYGRRGLVCCLCSEAQIDIVLAEAQRQRVCSRYSSPTQAKEKRMEELRSDGRLQRFYREGGISEDARRPIKVDDLKTLGLDLDEQGEFFISETYENGSDGELVIGRRQTIITLEEAVIDVIGQINKALTETPEGASIKGKRYILLDTNSEILGIYHRLGLPKGKHALTPVGENQRWLRRIINALVAKRHLFKLDRVNGCGYFIQA